MGLFLGSPSDLMFGSKIFTELGFLNPGLFPHLDWVSMSMAVYECECVVTCEHV